MRQTVKNIGHFFAILVTTFNIAISSSGHQEWQDWLLEQETAHADLAQHPELLAKQFAKVVGKNLFFIGASTSGMQFEGGNEKVFAKDGLPADAFIRNIKKDQTLPGDVILLWDNYREIIPQIKKELGINMLRISITWSRIEPDEGNFQEAAINQYVDIVKTLKENGIEPFVTFHHYTQPQWFMDKGDFIIADNMQFFARFCMKMYDALAEHVHYYSTMNGPESYAVRAYYSGAQYPYEKNLKKTVEVTAKLLNAHVQIYEGMKLIYQEKKINNPNMLEPMIGIQTAYYPVDPEPECSLKTWLISQATNKIQGESVWDFFRTGIFQPQLPGWANLLLGIESMIEKEPQILEEIRKLDVQYVNENAPKSLDFIALNTYSNKIQIGVSTSNKTQDFIQEIQKTEGKYYGCPQIIYRGIEAVFESVVQPIKEQYGKDIPIFISENGMKTTNENQRDWYYRQALVALYRARADGYPVIGYLPWSAVDCYGWTNSESAHGYGLIYATFTGEEINGIAAKKPSIGTVKQGAKFYADFAKAFLNQQ